MAFKARQRQTPALKSNSKQQSSKLCNSNLFYKNLQITNYQNFTVVNEYILLKT